MKHLIAVVIVLAAIAAGGLLFAWSGVYDIAATKPHWSVTLSFIEMLKDRSIETHSRDVQVPELSETKHEASAFPHYHEMCQLCHGAPGIHREEFAKGLYPSPPSMTSGEIQKGLAEEEIYWIVKHGIKMTGMPAFGPTHDEKSMSGLVALVEEMSQMSPEEYQRMIETMKSEGEEGHAHDHGDETTGSQNGRKHGLDENVGHGETEPAH